MLIPKPFLDSLCLAYCRLGGAGLSPVVPGTCGSAVAALLAPVLFLPLSFGLRVLFLIAIFFSGAAAATRVEQLTGQKDPGSVVIDELLGVWLVLLPFDQPSWGQIALSFLLFRIFDMWKPWPVHASELWLPNGYGVMIDDVLAALWALLCLCILKGIGLV